MQLPSSPDSHSLDLVLLYRFTTRMNFHTWCSLVPSVFWNIWKQNGPVCMCWWLLPFAHLCWDLTPFCVFYSTFCLQLQHGSFLYHTFDAYLSGLCLEDIVPISLCIVSCCFSSCTCTWDSRSNIWVYLASLAIPVCLSRWICESQWGGHQHPSASDLLTA